MKYKINKQILTEDFSLDDLDNMSRTEYPAAEQDAYQQRENMVSDNHNNKNWFAKNFGAMRDRYEFPSDQKDPTQIFRDHQNNASDEANNYIKQNNYTHPYDIQSKIADGINSRAELDPKNDETFYKASAGEHSVNQAASQDRLSLMRKLRYK